MDSADSPNKPEATAPQQAFTPPFPPLAHKATAARLPGTTLCALDCSCP
jgi:hypothetical protein